MWIQLLKTKLGDMHAIWTRSGLYSFRFGLPDDASLSPLEDAPHATQMLAKSLSRSLDDYFETGEFAWEIDQLDWTDVSPFHRVVLEHCFAIPAGETLSYGELARVAGSPKGARAVGGAMARNRWPILIPCHRVMGGSGELTGYSGTGGTATKRWLLELETAGSSKSLFDTAMPT